MNATAQKIPDGWENLTFNQAIEPITDEGKRVDRSEYLLEGVLPVVDQGEEFIGGYTNNTNLQYRGPLPVIVFGDHTRRVKLVDVPFVVGAQGVKLLKPKECWEPRFLAHLLPTLPLSNRGYGRHYQYLRQLKFPCPPRHLQRQIVAEIEKQFTRLEVGVAGLWRVQANLKRYRAAVLKAACEGKLVPTEAELQKSEVRGQKTKASFETGEALLARILTERRKNSQGRGQYKEPAAADTANLPPIPDGWAWASVEQLSTRVHYGSSAKTNEDTTGVPVLRMGNIRDGKFDFDKLKYLPKAHNEFPELLLARGDLLFNRTNSAELVGKTAVFKGTPLPCSFASYLIRVRLGSGCVSDFVSYFINSVFGRAWIADVVSQQVGQANVNGTKLQALAIPLPPLVEQQRIVAEVERRLSVVEELEAVVNANLQRATRLRQSILQRAFEGKLTN